MYRIQGGWSQFCVSLCMNTCTIYIKNYIYEHDTCTYTAVIMVNQGDSQQNDAMSARLVDSLKCELSVKESMLEHASTIINCEKNKISVVAKDSKIVLNSLLDDIQQVRWLVVGWLVGWLQSILLHANNT